MKFLKFLLLTALIVAVALPTAGLAQDDRPAIGAWEACPDPANLSGEIKIGVAFSLTGAASIYGTSQENAVKLAVEEINNSGYLGEAVLAPVYEDAGTAPEEAIAAMTKLVEEDQVVAVLGPTLTNQAVAADPIAQDAGVLVLAVSNTATGLEDAIGDFYLRVSLPEIKVIPGTVAQAVEILGIEKVGVMYSDNDNFTVSGYQVFVEALEANNIEILAEETFSTGDVDFSSQLTNIIAEEPDAIVVSALAAEIVPLLQQARDQGFTGPIIGGNGFNAPGIATEDRGAGKDANGVIVGGAWNAARQNELSQTFTAAYEEAYGVPADQFSVQAYTGAWVLATGIRCADSAESAAIRDSLRELKDFDTPLGVFGFDENGVPEHDPAAQIIIDGKYELLTEETAAQVFGE